MRNGPLPFSVTSRNRWPSCTSNGTSTKALPAGNAKSGEGAAGCANETPVSGSLNAIDSTTISSSRRASPRDARTRNGILTPLHLAHVHVGLGARLLRLALDEALDQPRVRVDPELERPPAFGRDPDDVEVGAVRVGALLVGDARRRALRVPEREPVAVGGVDGELARGVGRLDGRLAGRVLRPRDLAVEAGRARDRADRVHDQRAARRRSRSSARRRPRRRRRGSRPCCAACAARPTRRRRSRPSRRPAPTARPAAAVRPAAPGPGGGRHARSQSDSRTLRRARATVMAAPER